MAMILTDVQQAEVIALYAAGRGCSTIAKSFGVGAGTVWRTLKRHGIAARTQSEGQTRHTLRHDALDRLTPDAAYWCGFLFADGCVSQRPGRAPEVSLMLSAVDREHVEKLRTFLGSSHAITESPARPAGAYLCKAACRLSVSSAQLASRLRGLGRYEGEIDDQLKDSRDFWRGVVDGDGHLGVHGGHAEVGLAGSRRLLTAYAEFMTAAKVRADGAPLTFWPHKGSFSVTSSWGTAERIASLLYADAGTALDRKAAVAARIACIQAGRVSRVVARSHPDTHCAHGHMWTKQSTYMRSGAKECRECRTLAQRARRLARRLGYA